MTALSCLRSQTSRVKSLERIRNSTRRFGAGAGHGAGRPQGQTWRRPDDRTDADRFRAQVADVPTAVRVRRKPRRGGRRGQVAELLDALGYDAVDIGTLADSWRSEPGTPVYVQPYLAAQPEGLTEEESWRWFFEIPGVPVPADKVKELTATAVRRSAGDARATLTRD